MEREKKTTVERENPQSEMLDTLRFMKNWKIIDYGRLIVGFIEPRKDFVIGVFVVQTIKRSS